VRKTTPPSLKAGPFQKRRAGRASGDLRRAVLEGPTLDDECLYTNWFYGLEHARETIAEWLEYYNEQRPHSSLAGVTPAEYERAQLRTSTVTEEGGHVPYADMDVNGLCGTSRTTAGSATPRSRRRRGSRSTG